MKCFLFNCGMLKLFRVKSRQVSGRLSCVTCELGSGGYIAIHNLFFIQCGTRKTKYQKGAISKEAESEDMYKRQTDTNRHW